MDFESAKREEHARKWVVSNCTDFFAYASRKVLVTSLTHLSRDFSDSCMNSAEKTKWSLERTMMSILLGCGRR